MSKRFWAHVAGTVAFAATVLLGGCGFFPPLNSISNTVATSNSGDYVYTVNPTTNTLASFSISNASLTGIGTTATLPSGYAPNAVAVSRPNTYVFTGGNNAIYCFAISSSGTLTQNSSGGITGSAIYRQLATSPDGQWLLALDSLSDAIYVFSINTSTCALTLQQTVQWNLQPPVTNSTAGLVPAADSIKISPAGNYVAVALGPVGDQLYAFNTSTGQLSYQTYMPTVVNTSDLAVQFDSSSAYVFVARGNGSLSNVASSVNVYPIGTAQPLIASQTIASGNQPIALELDSSGTYLYAANSADNTISGYSFSAGTLTLVSGSPFANGSHVVALVHDNSKKYVLAAGTTSTTAAASNDITLYSLDVFTAGKLDPTALAASGTTLGAISIAATH